MFRWRTCRVFSADDPRAKEKRSESEIKGSAVEKKLLEDREKLVARGAGERRRHGECVPTIQTSNCFSGLIKIRSSAPLLPPRAVSVPR